MTGNTSSLDIIIFGLSVTSAWGNGHATTYRALVRALSEQGHRVRFFERNMPWYADNRDLPNPPYCRTYLYSSIRELSDYFDGDVCADAVIVGSYVPEGARLAEWLLPRATGITAFYDLDTPVTVARLERDDCEYLNASLIPGYDLYLSFAGGPILKRLRAQYGAQDVRPLYCSVDPLAYFPMDISKQYDLGYLGTYSSDRQPALERLLLEPARRWPEGRFSVAGPQYPATLQWPANVERTEHLPPHAHCAYYNSQRFTLNITRADMVANGYSPSVRLFEAAACGVPIITDEWCGLEGFFEPGREILIARSSDESLSYLHDMKPEQMLEIAQRARARVLNAHTSARRAQELVTYIREASEAGIRV